MGKVLILLGLFFMVAAKYSKQVSCRRLHYFWAAGFVGNRQSRALIGECGRLPHPVFLLCHMDGQLVGHEMTATCCPDMPEADSGCRMNWLSIASGENAASPSVLQVRTSLVCFGCRLTVFATGVPTEEMQLIWACRLEMIGGDVDGRAITCDAVMGAI